MYEDLVKQGRREVSKLTIGQLKEIDKIYKSTILSLADKATKQNMAGNWALGYMKEVEKARQKLSVEIAKSMYKTIKQTADIGVNIQKETMKQIFNLGGIDIGTSFSSMFNQVNDNIVRNIMSGGLYKDNKTLSSRVWNYGKDLEKDIQYIINQGILEKKGAKDLADDLREFVKPPPSRSAEWIADNPLLTRKYTTGRAMTLARTALNHSYQTATIQASAMNPFVEGIEWSTSGNDNVCDWCEDMENLDQYGLGPGIFPVDEVPIDHPNGVCTMIPYIIKSSSQVADELKMWQSGNNPKLDKWYSDMDDDN